jgi:hypothetical protein
MEICAAVIMNHVEDDHFLRGKVGVRCCSSNNENGKENFVFLP